MRPRLLSSGAVTIVLTVRRMERSTALAERINGKGSQARTVDGGMTVG
ncbi:hypothetical protein [Gimesia chilikensis]|nr:hypothetical protein [Gimesia chilikensis]